MGLLIVGSQYGNQSRARWAVWGSSWGHFHRNVVMLFIIGPLEDKTTLNKSYWLNFYIALIHQSDTHNAFAAIKHSSPPMQYFLPSHS